MGSGVMNCTEVIVFFLEVIDFFDYFFEFLFERVVDLVAVGGFLAEGVRLAFELGLFRFDLLDFCFGLLELSSRFFVIQQREIVFAFEVAEFFLESSEFRA